MSVVPFDQEHEREQDSGGGGDGADVLVGLTGHLQVDVGVGSLRVGVMVDDAAVHAPAVGGEEVGGEAFDAVGGVPELPLVGELGGEAGVLEGAGFGRAVACLGGGCAAGRLLHDLHRLLDHLHLPLDHLDLLLDDLDRSLDHPRGRREFH